jgi:hypothetical protein
MYTGSISEFFVFELPFPSLIHLYSDPYTDIADTSGSRILGSEHVLGKPKSTRSPIFNCGLSESKSSLVRNLSATLISSLIRVSRPEKLNFKY